MPPKTSYLLQKWREGYGMVYWFAHGLPDRISRVVWKGDANGNKRADADELISPVLLSATDLQQLPGGRPGFGPPRRVDTDPRPFTERHAERSAGRLTSNRLDLAPRE